MSVPVLEEGDFQWVQLEESILHDPYECVPLAGTHSSSLSQMSSSLSSPSPRDLLCRTGVLSQT